MKDWKSCVDDPDQHIDGIKNRMTIFKRLAADPFMYQLLAFAMIA
ncbi:hypothetical protein [Alkalicoccus luteus]|nr:hypothetical protein [Alkalicoccus luteus]